MRSAVAFALCATLTFAAGAEKPARPAVSETAPILLTDTDGTGLRLVGYAAKAVIDPPLAFTELHLTFENPEPRVREGQFEITLPPGAVLSRFAMLQENGWQEGEVVERQAARQAYEDFLHRKQDPALLENQAGNRFRARVFPIAASGRKELTLSYSEEIARSGTPLKLLVRGLPTIERFSVQAVRADATGGTYREAREGWAPERNYTLPTPAAEGPVALRNQDLVVARVRPVSQAREEPVRSLLVLFDTSASRALGFQAQAARLERILKRVRSGMGPAGRLRVACFDQEVTEVFDGPADRFGEEQVRKIVERRALGASDLGRALRHVADTAQGRFARLLLVTDGIATAGEIEGSGLKTLAGKLRAAGVERIDALVDGGIRDEGVLRRIVTAGLAKDGVVLDASVPESEILQRLTRVTVSNLAVTVPGARWVWPRKIDGVQPGDETIVYADVPPEKPFELSIAGTPIRVETRQATRPLLERAWASARIQSLVHERDTEAQGKPDLRESLRMEIIRLSTNYRVLSDFTALLVLESEADYARFKIDRKALADILVVGSAGVEVQDRKRPDYRLVVRPSLRTLLAKEADKTKSKPRVRNGFLKLDPNGPAPVVTPDVPVAEPPAPVAEPPAPRSPDARPGPVAAGSAESVMRASAESARQQSAERLQRARMAAEAERTVVLGAPIRRRVGHSALLVMRPPPAPEKKPEIGPYSGKLAEVMALLQAGKKEEALRLARDWRDEAPGDVLALVALGEALEAIGDLAGAARAYGSIIDLYPGRADLRRYAGERLERLGKAGLALAVDSYRKARDQRPDHPSSHRLLAYALYRVGDFAGAFDAIAGGFSRRYPSGRFAGVDRVLREDVGILGAAWMRAEPHHATEARARLAKLEVAPAEAPSLRFVLVWETDANDVDFHVHDAKEGHAYYREKQLASGGELYADVTNGYGPECFTLPGRPTAYPYKLRAHYYSKGPMGYGMGQLQILEHDGKGQLKIQVRPYVVMNDGGFVDLGTVAGPLE